MTYILTIFREMSPEPDPKIACSSRRINELGFFEWIQFRDVFGGRIMPYKQEKTLGIFLPKHFGDSLKS